MSNNTAINSIADKNKNYKIVSAENFDLENFCYAACKCTLLTEGIKIERKDYTRYVRFECPRCGKTIGMYVQGKKDPNHIVFFK